jgi:hypothetical protein
MSRFFPNYKNISEYSIFNKVTVQEQIEKIYKAVSVNERLENFDVMMIEYIKILFMPEPPTTRNMEMEVATTKTLVSVDDEKPNTGDGDTGDVDTKMVATTNTLVSVETKQILLTILEVAVRSCKLCSDDPDGIFKSLLSDSKINQEIDVDEQLKEIRSRAEKNIARNQHIKSVKENFLQLKSTRQSTSKNTLERSGETSGLTPEMDRHGKGIPKSDQSTRSAFAVPYTSKLGWGVGMQVSKNVPTYNIDEARSLQLSDFMDTQDNILQFGDESDNSWATGSNKSSPVKISPVKQENTPQEINILRGQIISKDEEIIKLKNELSNYKFATVTDSDEQVVKSRRGSRENTPIHFLTRVPTNEEEGVTTPKSTHDNEGGSRKHHIQTHKTVTRRKNKKSPKRKTIKKRKMPKRNAKTRRQRK